MKKLDPKIKRKWLKALRSGEYVQCTKALCRSEHSFENKGYDTFCCLGVLWDVASGKWSDYRDASNRYQIQGSSGAWFSGFLPDEKILDHETQQKLMEMNDSGGKSFKQIANWIEKHL